MSTKRSIEEINEYLSCKNASYRAIQESEEVGYLDCFCYECKQLIKKNRNKLHQGCPICKGKILCVGVNDLATTAPWMIPYLKDEKDAHRYMKSASKRIMFKCPDCGHEKEYKINNVFNFGFSCDLCGDGISRPNKFARALFIQLPVDNLCFEYSSEWTNRKIYDIYFEYEHKKYVVEMDGEQHFNNTNWGKQYIQGINDGYKDFLAWQMNINIVRIPCKSRDYESMIQAFKSSAIGEIINKVDVDWSKCILATDKNFLPEICNYYEQHPGCTTTDLEKVFQFDRHTIQKYLVTGSQIGFCSYDKKYEKIKNGKKLSKKYAPILKKEKEKRIKIACDYANNHTKMPITEMSEKLNINRLRLIEYIKTGINNGICFYPYDDMVNLIRSENAKKGAQISGKKTKVYEGEKFVGQYNNMRECVDSLNVLYPTKNIKRDTIRKQLVKSNEYYYKGLLFVSM